MPKSRTVVALIAVALCLPLARSLHAQTEVDALVNAPAGTPEIPIRNGYVNLNSGNLHLDIPLLSVPERGAAPSNLTLSYDSTFWQETPIVNYSPNRSPWTLRANNGLPAAGSASPEDVRYQSCGSGLYGEIEYYTNWTFTDSAGNYHVFSPGTTTTDNCENSAYQKVYPNGVGAQTASGAATDGSGYFIAIANGDTPTLFAPDGSTFASTTNGNIGSMSTVQPNGTVLTVAESDVPGQGGVDVSPGTACTQGYPQTPYAAQASTTCQFTFRPLNGGSGNGAQFSIAYEYIPVCTAYYTNSAYAQSGYDFCGGIWTVQSLTLPDGSSYSFSYDSGTSGAHYGRLTQMKLPTGGTTAYSYFPPDGTGATYVSQIRGDVQSITDNGGTTTFSRTFCPQGTACYVPYQTETVTYPPHVADPSSPNMTVQDKSVFTTSVQNANTTPLQQSVTRQDYLGNTLAKTSSWDATTIGAPSFVQTTWNQTGATDRTQYTYTSGYVVQRADESINGSLYRSKVRQYQQDTPSIAYVSQYHMVNLPTQTQILDANGNVVAQETRAYDEYGASYCNAGPPGVGGVPMLTNVTGAVGHDDTNFGASRWARGNPTTITTSTSSSTSTTKHNCFDTLGNVTESVDGNGNATSYSYIDNYQDHSCIASGTPTYALPTLMTDAIGHQTKMAYNSCMRGLVQKQDANDLAANRAGITQSYDSFGRSSCRTAADSGQTCTVYDSPTEMHVNGPIDSVETFVDGWGNPSRTIDVGSNSEVDSTYDNSGRLNTVSTPHDSSSSVLPQVTIYAYDGLGRTTAQLQSDGTSELKWQYTGQNIDAYDEAGIHRQLVYDAAGRLLNVFELGTSASPANLETDYLYDERNNLKTVTQHGVSGEVSRVRTFAYDWASRLITVSNPENGTICYGQWSGPSVGLGSCQGGYDQNGNLLMQTDARGEDTTYTYDSLNRIVTKNRVGGSTDSFFYDGQVGQYGNTGLLGNNLIGRLSFTRSYNLDLTGGSCNPSGQRMCDDQYLGYDPVGRPNHFAEALPSEWGTTSQSTDAKYDLAGNMTDLSYPDGTAITQGFDVAGRVTNIKFGTTAQPGASIISSVNYSPSETPLTINYANGVSETFTKNDRLQPCHHIATDGSLNIMDRQYFYNTNDTSSPCGNEASNNGSIWHIVDGLPSATNSQNFTMDGLNRLSTFEGPNMSGAYRSQGFTYDSFGNIQATNAYSNAPASSPNVVGTPSARMFPNPNFTASSGWPYDANNHLLDATFDCTGPNGTHYDAAGNVQCDGSNTDLNARQYAWDAESRVTRVNAQHMGNTYDPTALYTYDADGNRIRADQLNTSGISAGYREYSFFNGLMLAEKNQAGSAAPVWTDYIYANGQKIAKLDQQKPVLQMQGTRDSNINMGCGVEGAVSGAGGAGLVIGQGDKLAFDMQQTVPTYGGLALIFTNGDGSGDATDTGGTGQPLYFNGTTDSNWHHLIGDLSPHAGETVSYVLAGIHNQTPTGTFTVKMANAAIVHADGTDTQLYVGQAASVGGFQSGSTCGAYNESSGTVIAPVDASEGATYYLADHLGTTQIELGGGGWPVWEGQFAPFGQELDPQNTTMRFKFTGKERDAESGLDNFGARYYGSSMGRFMSPDDGSDQDITNPQSLNLYSYVQNNPLTNTDPDGHTCQTNSTDGTTYDDLDGKGCDAVDKADAQRLQNGDYDANVNGGGSSSLGTVASNVGDFISGAASSTMNFVSQVGSQLSNIAQTPGGIGCMASLAGSGGMAGAAVGGGVGLVGLAGGGVGVVVTEPAGLLIGGAGGAASGLALGMTVCPGGALAMSNGGKGLGGNQRENKQANDAKQQAERETGKKFDRALDRKFHDEITGQGYGYHKLVDIAKQVLQGHI